MRTISTSSGCPIYNIYWDENMFNVVIEHAGDESKKVMILDAAIHQVIGILKDLASEKG